MEFGTEQWQSEPALAPHHKGGAALGDGVVIGNQPRAVKYATADDGKSAYKFELFDWATKPPFQSRSDDWFAVGALGRPRLEVDFHSGRGHSWSAVASLELPGVLWSYS